MGLPKVYQTAGAGPVVQYDGIDLATGRGMTDLFAGIASGAAIANPNPNATWGILSNLEFYSDKVQSRLGQLAPLHFEMEFELPKIIEGKAIIQAPIAGYNSGGGDININWTASLAHIDTTGQSTILAEGGFKTLKLIPASATQASMAILSVDIASTKFVKGEKLRLSLNSIGAGGDDRAIIAHDPKNREFIQGLPSQLIVQVPFKIDI